MLYMLNYNLVQVFPFVLRRMGNQGPLPPHPFREVGTGRTNPRGPFLKERSPWPRTYGGTTPRGRPS